MCVCGRVWACARVCVCVGGGRGQEGEGGGEEVEEVLEEKRENKEKHRPFPALSRPRKLRLPP